MKQKTCNDCSHCIMKGEHVTCGLLLADSDEDPKNMSLADGIHHSFAEMCEDYIKSK